MTLPRPPKHELSSAAQDLLRHGRKIDAIKLIRAETGLGLKEAKDLADAWEPHLARRAPPGEWGGGGTAGATDGLAPGEQPRRPLNPKAWLGIAAAVAALIAIALLRDRL